MKELNRQPSRFERIVAIIVAGILAALFGVLAALAVMTRELGVFVIFGVLFLISAVLFYRFAFTAPRALSRHQLRAVAWFMLLSGGMVITYALKLDGPLSERLPALGTGLSLLGAGIAGIWFQRDVS